MKLPRVTVRKLAITAAAVALAAGAVAVSTPSSAGTDTGTSTTYLVLYSAGASSANASSAVAAAGGTLVANYSQIGVVIARSSMSDFAAAMKTTKGVNGAVATTRFGTQLKTEVVADAAPAATVTATWGDSLSGLQWDMTNIHVPEAHAINAGSTDVLVADLDTGLDFTHPDLAPNYDAATSRDCSSGAPTALLPGNDQNGHGTHTAGTIAAAANGTGVVGVAPNVKIAGIKTSNDDGFFFPEMVVCAFVWAAEHGVDITNNSYFADPWEYNCKNDPEQRAIWNAERRAIGYAQSKGVLVVAAEGNDSDDLSHPTTDITSPDFPPNSAVERDVTNACAVVPVEVPGVVGVTATGFLHYKSYFSSYGISTADVAAPGGDRRFQIPPSTGNGRVLSTYSSNALGAFGVCAIPAQLVIENGAYYCWLQGTSMASPHAVGVAALILSAHPGMPASAIAAMLKNGATPLSCPADMSSPVDYVAFPGVNSGLPQECTGGAGHTSFTGAGEVDALTAVS
ncbi:MAG TPA: S8 family serine peptidase [Actinomycetes bacterium]|jgi:subtilisin family serine protease